MFSVLCSPLRMRSKDAGSARTNGASSGDISTDARRTFFAEVKLSETVLVSPGETVTVVEAGVQVMTGRLEVVDAAGTGLGAATGAPDEVAGTGLGAATGATGEG